MNTQWFSVKDVLPPIGFEVVFAYSNSAYAGHLSPILGRIVSEGKVISAANDRVFRIGSGDDFSKYNPIVTHWAYNLMPDPSVICDCFVCTKNK